MGQCLCGYRCSLTHLTCNSGAFPIMSSGHTLYDAVLGRGPRQRQKKKRLEAKNKGHTRESLLVVWRSIVIMITMTSSYCSQRYTSGTSCCRFTQRQRQPSLIKCGHGGWAFVFGARSLTHSLAHSLARSLTI